MISWVHWKLKKMGEGLRKGERAIDQEREDAETEQTHLKSPLLFSLGPKRDFNSSSSLGPIGKSAPRKIQPRSLKIPKAFWIGYDFLSSQNLHPDLVTLAGDSEADVSRKTTEHSKIPIHSGFSPRCLHPQEGCSLPPPSLSLSGPPTACHCTGMYQVRNLPLSPSHT